jgi:hypothetical protein
MEVAEDQALAISGNLREIVGVKVGFSLNGKAHFFCAPNPLFQRGFGAEQKKGE